jgi:hypothetical protein
MSTGKHYFLEQMPDGRYAVRAKGAQEASGIFSTQQEAIHRIEELNQGDHPDVEECVTCLLADATNGGGRINPE